MPAPYCYKCRREHEQIPWTTDRKVYRCNGCNAYGGHIPVAEVDNETEAVDLEQFYDMPEPPLRVFTPSAFRLGVAV